MIRGAHPVLQAFLGTLMTWGLTALGAAFVFCTRKRNRKLLDVCLGFAAGVMTAASFWSLLAPGIEMAENSGIYGEEGEYAFGPTGIGFLLGSVFVAVADLFMKRLTKRKLEGDGGGCCNLGSNATSPESTEDGRGNPAYVQTDANEAQLKAARTDSSVDVIQQIEVNVTSKNIIANWRRILLLIIAITVHNVPEGLAVGVAFGAAHQNVTEGATFENARALAIGIGIQNFPEGLAVSLPLKACGYSNIKSFLYGQMSGMVEPISGILGAVAVIVFDPLLPYALSFAAGAMIYVVIDDIIPEAQMEGNGRWASAGATVGFIVMMCLDVGLG